MVSFFISLLFKNKTKNFEVDWSLEPTICILCGKKEKCECICIRYLCNKCCLDATDCVCLERSCKVCNKLIVDCECKYEKYI
jgi:hypothetical protein